MPMHSFHLADFQKMSLKNVSYFNKTRTAQLRKLPPDRNEGWF